MTAPIEGALLDHRQVHTAIRAARDQIRQADVEGSAWLVADLLEQYLDELAVYEDAAGLLTSHQQTLSSGTALLTMDEIIRDVEGPRRQLVWSLAQFTISLAGDLADPRDTFTGHQSYAPAERPPAGLDAPLVLPSLPSAVADGDHRWDGVRTALTALRRTEQTDDRIGQLDRSAGGEDQLDVAADHAATLTYRLQDYATAVADLYAQHWSTLVTRS
ncbi:hypothetical protein ACIA49_38560 [Kribbella sp. NPDC051587]|uniref:hypothetical protein n=1 Tax=Kribbella sp. NPDC051587 TaxID=3364119 RepID=UPI0037A7FABB